MGEVTIYGVEQFAWQQVWLVERFGTGRRGENGIKMSLRRNSE